MHTFTSATTWDHPDVHSYEAQKGVHMITQESEMLWAYEITSKMPPMPLMLGNNNMSQLWSYFYGPRLSAAMQGEMKRFTSFFPGHTVPGKGAGRATRRVGSLAIERFKCLLGLGGGFPNIGSFVACDQPQHSITNNVPDSRGWPWKHVRKPTISVVLPSQTPTIRDEIDIKRLLVWHESEIVTHLKANRVQDVLTLIRLAWSPHTKPPVWAPETVSAARVLFDWSSESENFLATAFEIESVLSHVQYSWPLNVSGFGEYRGSWVEVGRLPIGDIKCTELAVTERVLHELVNVRTKGFAPIIVNEYGCDTDGTHRIVGSWTWNLLRHVGNIITAGVDSDIVQSSVGEFIERHRREMGEVVVRESLRSLAEMLINPTMSRTLREEVMPHVENFYPVTHLPVLLLPEYSCGAVIKGPYDEGRASYRVDPKVYEMMSVDSSLTLPARGPYHLTDRAPLPWFKVLERR